MVVPLSVCICTGLGQRCPGVGCKSELFWHERTDLGGRGGIDGCLPGLLLSGDSGSTTAMAGRKLVSAGLFSIIMA